METIKILHLPLKAKWYDMQECGEKTEEYRELTEYWRKRLLDQETLRAKPYTHVCFHYGYTRRCFIHRIDSITIGMGLPEWGAPTYREVFIIKHHKEDSPILTRREGKEVDNEDYQGRKEESNRKEVDL